MSLNSEEDFREEYTRAKEELAITKAQMEVSSYMFNIFLCLTLCIIVISIYYFFIRDRFICNAFCGGGRGMNGHLSQIHPSHSVRSTRINSTTTQDNCLNSPLVVEQQPDRICNNVDDVLL